MNRDERMQFIESEIKTLWSRWDPTEAEVRVWMAELATLDYGLARRAAQACFAELTVNAHRPVLGRFLAKARALAEPSAGQDRRTRDVPETTVFLECLQPPRDKPRLAGVRKPVYVRPLSRQSDPDYVAACADSMRLAFNRLYGGNWIVVRLESRHGLDKNDNTSGNWASRPL